MVTPTFDVAREAPSRDLFGSALPAEDFPESFRDVEDLEEFMTRPHRALVEDLARVDGDILILGVAGKMGPTLARLAKRAASKKRIVGAARFSDPDIRAKLEAWGVETVTCDLLSREQIAALPALSNVIYMAGRKFGDVGSLDLTWAMNVFVPALVAESFAASRIVVFSTGCVYPYANVSHQGAIEATPINPPAGEYANSCVGRERMFEYFSRSKGTPGRIIRLNYAIDMRYGVLHDIARKVISGTPVDLATGHVNVIWQGDANSHALRALRHCTLPTAPINISGPETVSIRALAQAFGARFEKDPAFTGTESETAWLVNTTESAKLFGYPRVPLGRMIDWVTAWVRKGLPTLDKPTQFEVRDGVFTGPKQKAKSP